MSRAGLLALLIWSLIAAGLATRDGALLGLSLPLLAYLTVAAITRPSADKLSIDSSLEQSSVTEGQVVEIYASVRSAVAVHEELWVEDLLPADTPVVSGQHSTLTHLPAGQHIELNYRLQAARGLLHLPGLRLVSGDPFNLFAREWIEPFERTLLVRPAFGRVRRVDIRPAQTGIFAGAYPARVGGQGVEFFGVRDYMDGDLLRRINWKASARHPGSLFVNQYEQDRVIDIGLIVDARRRSNASIEGRSAFSYSIQAAASLAELFLSQGNRVGLLLYGSHLDWTVPAYGRVQRERIMLALARAAEGESRIFDHIHYLPTRLFRPKSQLILLSPVLHGDVNYLIRLRARRYPLLVISPKLESIESRLVQDDAEASLAYRLSKIEEALISRYLMRSGVQRLIWDVELPFEHVVEAQLGRPLGRMRSAIGEA